MMRIDERYTRKKRLAREDHAKEFLLIVLEYVRGDAKQTLSMERIHDPAQQSMISLLYDTVWNGHTLKCIQNDQVRLYENNRLPF